MNPRIRHRSRQQIDAIEQTCRCLHGQPHLGLGVSLNGRTTSSFPGRVVHKLVLAFTSLPKRSRHALTRQKQPLNRALGLMRRGTSASSKRSTAAPQSNDPNSISVSFLELHVAAAWHLAAMILRDLTCDVKGQKRSPLCFASSHTRFECLVSPSVHSHQVSDSITANLGPAPFYFPPRPSLSASGSCRRLDDYVLVYPQVCTGASTSFALDAFPCE